MAISLFGRFTSLLETMFSYAGGSLVSSTAVSSVAVSFLPVSSLSVLAVAFLGLLFLAGPGPGPRSPQLPHLSYQNHVKTRDFVVFS